jgi:hypothetical protein
MAQGPTTRKHLPLPACRGSECQKKRVNPAGGAAPKRDGAINRAGKKLSRLYPDTPAGWGPAAASCRLHLRGVGRRVTDSPGRLAGWWCRTSGPVLYVQLQAFSAPSTS